MLLDVLPHLLAESLTDTPNYSDIHPDATALPGGAVAQSMLRGLMFYSLLFCIAGFALGAGLWAVGSFSSNYTQSVNGKKTFLICAGASMFIGAAYFLVSWFYGAGQTVKAS